MANEITLSTALRFSKNGGGASIADYLSLPFAGQLYHQGRQTVSTTEVALNLASVPAGGTLYVRNTDGTNYVQVKAATGATPLIRIKAGRVAVFGLDAGATAPFVQANTAPCVIEYLLLED